MSYTSCRPATDFLTEFLAEPEAMLALRSMRTLGKPPAAYVEFFAATAPAEVAETVREQLGLLPAIAVTSMLDAWALADESGKSFAVVSEIPESTLDFARQRRIRISIEVDEISVRVGLAHIHGHHP